eukprot:788865-Pelagomonas_calceolata.AAC.4
MVRASSVSEILVRLSKDTFPSISSNIKRVEGMYVMLHLSRRSLSIQDVNNDIQSGPRLGALKRPLSHTQTEKVITWTIESTAPTKVTDHKNVSSDRLLTYHEHSKGERNGIGDGLPEVNKAAAGACRRKAALEWFWKR